MTPTTRLVPLLLLLLLPPIVAQRSFETLLPDHAIATLSMAGLEAWDQNVENLQLMRLWEDPKFQASISPLIEMMRKAAREAPEPLDEAWKVLRTCFRGRVGLGLAHVVALPVPGRDIPWMPLPGLMAAIDVGQDRSGIEAVVERSLRELRRLERVEIQDAEHRGHAFVVLRIPIGRRGPILELALGSIDNLFVLAHTQALYEALLDQAALDPATSLAGNPAYRRASAQARGDTAFGLFVNVRALSSSLAFFTPLQWRRALSRLGLAGVESLYLASSVHEGESEGLFFVGAPAPRQGLLAPTSREGLSPEALRIPFPTALMTIAAKVPAREVLEVVREVVLPELPAPHGRSLERMLERGLPDETWSDLVTSLGNEFVASIDLGRITKIPSLVVGVGVRDPDRARRAMAAMLAEYGLESTTLDFEGHTLTQVKVPLEELDVPGLGKLRLQPAFTITETHLIAGFTRLNLQNALTRLRNAAEKDFVQAPSVAAAFGSAPLGGSFLLLHADIPRALRIATGFGLNPDIGLELTGTRPAGGSFTLEDLAPHAFPIAVWGAGDGDGISLRARFPGSSTLLAMAGRAVLRADMNLLAAATGLFTASEVHVAPAGADQPVNPLPEGSPEEAAYLRRLASIERAMEEMPPEMHVHLRFERANLLHRVRRLEEAAREFQQCYEDGTNALVSAYNAACCHALLGDVESALSWLQRARAAGFRNRRLAERDTDLDSLRSDARFAEWLASISGGQ